MESLVILTIPNKDSFDVIIGKLNVENLQEAEHTDHFELTILQRRTNLKGDTVKDSIKWIIEPYLNKIESKVKDHQKAPLS